MSRGIGQIKVQRTETDGQMRRTYTLELPKRRFGDDELKESRFSGTDPDWQSREAGPQPFQITVRECWEEDYFDQARRGEIRIFLEEPKIAVDATPTERRFWQASLLERTPVTRVLYIRKLGSAGNGHFAVSDDGYGWTGLDGNHQLAVVPVKNAVRR